MGMLDNIKRSLFGGQRPMPPYGMAQHNFPGAYQTPPKGSPYPHHAPMPINQAATATQPPAQTAAPQQPAPTTPIQQPTPAEIYAAQPRTQAPPIPSYSAPQPQQLPPGHYIHPGELPITKGVCAADTLRWVKKLRTTAIAGLVGTFGAFGASYLMLAGLDWVAYIVILALSGYFGWNMIKSQQFIKYIAEKYGIV